MVLWTAAAVSPAEERGVPYRPADDEVVERLPVNPILPRQSVVAAMRKVLDDPNNVDLATQAATGFLAMAGSTGDVRFDGYATRVLSPWWDDDDAPPAIVRMVAKLLEKQHRYEPAIAKLTALVSRDPDDVAAWIELSNLYRVVGRYDEASEACDEVARRGNDRQRLACEVPLMILDGRADQVGPRLDAVDWTGEMTAWVASMRAAAAVARGEDEAADRWTAAAVEADPLATYPRRARAEWLIDAGRFDDAVDVVVDSLHDNGSLLLAAVAATLTGDQDRARDWTAELRDRFAAVRRRGENPHGRFESRFELQLNHRPQRALDIALENWRRQKELRDMRSVLTAAAAAGQVDAAAPVVQFIRRHQLQHVDLERWIAAVQ